VRVAGGVFRASGTDTLCEYLATKCVIERFGGIAEATEPENVSALTSGYGPQEQN